MAFGEDVKRAAYRRANGQCECMRQSCMAHYAGRCTRSLADGWRAHRVDPDGPESMDNCEALCIPCYEAESARLPPARFRPRRHSMPDATPRPHAPEATSIRGGAGVVGGPARVDRNVGDAPRTAPPPARGDPDD